MATDRYCVMGNPVEHSLSPQIHARFAELTGQSLRYDKQRVALDGFAAGIQKFQAKGGLGCNVTVPFKEQAARLATAPSARVTLAGACNTLRFGPDPERIEGENTDGDGLMHDITVNAGVDITGRDVLLLGAGGASAGVLGPLLAQKPKRVVVANRTLQRAQLLTSRHAPLAGQSGTQLFACRLDDARLKTHRFAIVINGTASSLTGVRVPVPASVLQPGALAVDMMYGQAAQEFLTWAREHGGAGRDGLGMLVEQAALAFEWWRGVRPPSLRVLNELRVSLLVA